MLAEYDGELLKVGKIWPKPLVMKRVYVRPYKGVREMYFLYIVIHKSKGPKRGGWIFLNFRIHNFLCAPFNPLNPELNPICCLLALLGAHHFLHVSRIRVKLLTFRLLMLYIYGAPILDVSRSHTTTQHSR